MISILVPVFNRESFLAECLESACAQTLRDIEIVVVDNASTDGTWDICRRFEKRDSRFRIFRNAANIGPVRNWLRCFAEARGAYGKVLFSDDLISPDFLEKTAAYLDDPEVGFVFSAAIVGETARYRWNHRAGKQSSARFLRDAICGGDLPVSPGAALFRLADLRANLRTGIPSASGEDFASHGAGPDLLLYLLTAASYPSVAHVDEPLAFFRRHPGSISCEKSAQLGDCYTQARVWFASRTKEPSYLAEALAAAWLSRMNARRRWVRPAEIRRAFLEPAIDFPLRETPRFFSSLRYLCRRTLSGV